MNYRCVVEGKKLLKSSNVFLFRSSLPSPLSSLFVGELDESEKECMDLTCSHVQHLQFLLGEKKRGWRFERILFFFQELVVFFFDFFICFFLFFVFLFFFFVFLFFVFL